MTSNQIEGTSAIVTGASRGFGRAVATALARAGARVVGVARNGDALEKLRAELGDAFTPVVGDVTDAELAQRLLREYRPRTLVLNAGTNPVPRPLQEHSWETFGAAWETDVRQAFNWLGAALREPLAPGSTVLSMSSGAALFGSPISGGYAGAKATVRFVSGYAREESERSGLGIRFSAVLPELTPETELGARAVAAYAARNGVAVPTFVQRMGAVVTPELVGRELLALARSPEPPEAAYLLKADGLQAL